MTNARNNEEVKRLCLNLLHADSEEEVISILRKFGYWDDPKAWRLIGDREGNYSTIGNQQNKPEAALAEKVINSIDARLMNECLVNGIDPESQDAPGSIREAVARFFEGKETFEDYGGTFQNWDTKRRREVSQGITVTVTGSRRRPSITISDVGEGQTPNRMHETFLSIDRTNKLKIHFVQGTYNMGGTGVLRFCGRENLQLIVTRRNPLIVEAMKERDPSSGLWGFTIVRRESPPQNLKNSIYTYLSPVDVEELPRHGQVLTFKADSLALMPTDNRPYARDVEWGSTVKMYEYDMKGFTGRAFGRNALLYRLGARLPDPALPVRIHECRDFGGDPSRSFSTTLTGLTVRLEDNKAGNLEQGFPDSVEFSVAREQMVAKIYAFKKGKAKTYRTNEGVIFTYNGQTQGTIPKTIFGRKNVKMGRLADSLLIIVDCSRISYRAREILFMNSRDRLGGGDFRKEVEDQLEEILHRHEGLRELREKRKSQEIAERLEDSRSLEEALGTILKLSPSLSALFLSGQRLPRPHKKQSGGDKNGQGNGTAGGENEFQGKSHPTYFRFRKRKDGELLVRQCEKDRSCRIAFETDVTNDYFDRVNMPGRFALEVLEGEWQEDDINWNRTLHDGVAQVSIKIPEGAVPGDVLTLQFAVEDDTLLDPYVNVAKLHVRPKLKRNGGGATPTRTGHAGKGELPQESGIQLPKIHRVSEQEWNSDFDKFSACKIVQDEDEQDEDKDVYEFYVNIDNLYLRTDMKQSREDPKLLEERFVLGNVLFGLALIRHFREREKQVQEEISEEPQEISESMWGRHFTVEEYVIQTTRALAPFLLPMIDSLGSLSEGDLSSEGQIGDDE